MNILIINLTNIFIPNPAKEHFLGVKEGFEANGVNVYSILPRFKNEKNNINKENIDFINLNLNYNKTFQRKLGLLLFLICVLIKLPKILKNKKINILYTRSTILDFIYFKIAHKLGIKCVSELNGSLYWDRKLSGKNMKITKMLEILEKKALLNSDIITCPTSNLIEKTSKKYNLNKNKFILIQNGISKQELKEKQHNDIINNKKDKFIIGFAGLFSKWQGIENIPKAVSLLSIEIQRNIKVVLVGDGKERKNIKKIIEELNLNELFIFTGLLNRKEYLKEIENFDIAIAPYIEERNSIIGISPLKLLSYLSQKKPVIISEISGVKEIMAEAKCGYLFDPNNIKELKECIEKAYKEKNLTKLGINGFNYLKNNLTWDKQMRKLVDYILETEEKEKC